MPPQSRLGDKSLAPVDAHGCPICPHPVQGPAITGAFTVLVNNMPALRVSDQGLHAACCGPNTWIAVMGSTSVMINSLPAHRLGDLDTHCGVSPGNMIDGSFDVITGG